MRLSHRLLPIVCAASITALTAVEEVAPPLCDGPPPDQAEMLQEALAEMAPANGAASDVEIDALLSTNTNRYVTNSVTQITFSFYDNDIHNGAYYGSERVSEVSEQVKTSYREIFTNLEKVIEIDFVEVTETANNWGQIRIMLSERYDTGNTDSQGNAIWVGPNYAYAYYPTSTSINSRASDIHLRNTYDHASNTNGWQNGPGKHGYMSLVHELGHAGVTTQK